MCGLRLGLETCGHGLGLGLGKKGLVYVTVCGIHNLGLFSE